MITKLPVFKGIFKGQTVLLCNARDLHEYMKVPCDFVTWLTYCVRVHGFNLDVEVYKFSSSDDPKKEPPISIDPEDLKKYVPASQKSDSGDTQVDFVITTKIAEELATVQSSVDYKALAETMRNLSVDDSGNIYLKEDPKMISGLKSIENSQEAKNPNALVPVFKGVLNGEEQLLCNARELHEHLQVGRVFANWIKGRIEEYGFVENQDFIAVCQNRQIGFEAQEGIVAQMGNKSGRGRPSKEYYLTLDMAKELAMVEKTEVGRQVRKYFIQCESEIHKSLNSQIIDIQKQLEEDYLDQASWNNAVSTCIQTLICAFKMHNLLLNYKPVLENHTTQQYSLFLARIYDRHHLFKHQYKLLKYHAERLQNEDYANMCLDSLSALEKYYERT